MEAYSGPPLSAGNRWVNREEFSSGRAIVQLIKCALPGCMQPEMWDSTFEIQQHNEKYHADLYKQDADFAPLEDPIDWADQYEPGSFEATFAALYQEAFELLVERQKKYGPNNIRQLGLFGTFGRFSDDKVERIRRALNGKVVNGKVILDPIDERFGDETFEDALLDSTNYPLIMLALHRDLWGAPLEEDMNG